jgi:putative FmdB family regulatory protein
MPLYEYSCRQCDNEFEMLVFADQEAVECPRCESARVEKKMSIPARPVTSLSVSGCGTQGPPCGPGCCRAGGS